MAHRFLQYLLRNQVLFAFLLIVTGWVIFIARSILISVFISYIIMAALIPFVTFLKKKGIPNLVAVIIAYFGVLTFLVMLVFPLVPFIGHQIQTLLDKLPQYLDQAGDMFGVRIDAQQVQQYITREFDSIGKNAISVTGKVFGGLFSTLTILIVSFYLLLDHETFKKWLARFFHRDSRERVLIALRQVDEKLGAWLRGQITLCVVIGFMTWIALTLLGVPNAIPLALLAGILEAIPTLGPILSAVPAIIIGLTVSPTLALTLVGVYTLIQFLENNILVPKIMQKAVGLNPVIVILAVMAGANLMGISGALLAIPFIAFVIVIVDNLFNDNSSA